MNNISYVKVDERIKTLIATQYGKVEADHLHLDDNSFSLAAIDDKKVVGFISAYPKKWIKPLTDTFDAYIDIIEVHKEYRRLGVAKNMIKHCEEWAVKEGYSQIRAWSSDDKNEAIPMWVALDYCMCPAEIWIEWCKEVVNGYYVAKKLITE